MKKMAMFSMRIASLRGMRWQGLIDERRFANIKALARCIDYGPSQIADASETNSLIAAKRRP